MKKELWWRHARIPLAVFVPLTFFFAATNADIAIAGLFFDSAGGGWSGAHSWWTNEFLHTGGRWAVRALVVMAIAVAIAGNMDRSLRPVRRPALYFALSVILTTGIVGLLKVTTNVDCPWDLTAFGGRFPYVHLFADRPDTLRHAQCFPAAHASSGYALLALYFVFREHNAVWARLGLTLGIVTGLVFGLGQQARGAHFVSHDVWSAFAGWMVALTLYVFVFKTRLWPETDRTLEPRAPVLDEALASRRSVAAAGNIAVPGSLGECRRPASQ